MIDDDRSSVLILATDAEAGAVLLESATDGQWAALLHGLLGLLNAAAREVLTELGLLAVGVEIERIADGEGTCPDPFGDLRIAASLVLAYSAARAEGAESGFCAFGMDSFDAALTGAETMERLEEVTIAVAEVWRRVLPWLFSEDGREILRRVDW